MAEQQGGPAAPNGEAACGRTPLIEAITTFLARDHAPALGEIRASLERAIDQSGPDALLFLGNRLASAGTDWSYYPKDPLARRIHHILADQVLEQDSVLLGTEHLAAVTSALRDRARGNRRLILDCLGLAIAELLPRGYRGSYGDHVPELDEARRLLRDRRIFGAVS